MRFFMVFFIALIFLSCSSSENTIETIDNEPLTADPEKNQTSKVVEAKLIRKKAYNKVGKEMPYPGDFYLVSGGKEVFVKLMDSKVTSEKLETLLNKKSKFRIIEQNGLWDTDDPKVQSRIGDYVSIIEIIE
jgi:hypothetical protein